MANSTIAKPFTDAYQNCALYPAQTSLILKTSFPGALKSHAKRLEEFAGRLFSSGSSHVLFREFTGIGPNGGLEKETVTDDASLQKWLGDPSNSNPIGGLATKKDPKCRFIFITAKSSRDPLKITQPMLRRILTYHQVMPGYLDFLYVFGQQTEARDLRFSGFREQTSLSKPPHDTVSPALRRSGRQFQLSYNLKAVACKSELGTKLSDQEWSIRHAAIHHQFDIEEGTSLWIITHGNLSIKERVTEMTAIHGRPEDRAFNTPAECFRTSLTTHLLYCHWSIEEWRWYIQWLEEVIKRETDIAVYGTRNRKGEFIYTPDHVQLVQHREDKINTAIMVLEANTDVIVSLRNFYKRLVETRDFDLKSSCEDDITTFAFQIDNLIYDSKMQIARAKDVVKMTSDRKSLILQHLQTQATGKMEELTNLTIKIGTMAQREAIAMRIITVVTLIYLPATFVSTFFSTDIVKYQDQNSGNGNNTSSTSFMGSFSKIALERWLQVTIPLTFLTLVIGWTAFKRSGKKADQEFEIAQLQLPIYEISPKTDSSG